MMVGEQDLPICRKELTVVIFESDSDRAGNVFDYDDCYASFYVAGVLGFMQIERVTPIHEMACSDQCLCLIDDGNHFCVLGDHKFDSDDSELKLKVMSHEC